MAKKGKYVGCDKLNTTRKTCSRCGRIKILEEFAIKKQVKSGRTSQCKKCLSELKKAKYVHKPRKERAYKYNECTICHKQYTMYSTHGKYCKECKTLGAKVKDANIEKPVVKKTVKLGESCDRSNPLIYQAYLEANPGYAYMIDAKKYPLPEGVI